MHHCFARLFKKLKPAFSGIFSQLRYKDNKLLADSKEEEDSIIEAAHHRYFAILELVDRLNDISK